MQAVDLDLVASLRDVAESVGDQLADRGDLGLVGDVEVQVLELVAVEGCTAMPGGHQTRKGVVDRQIDREPVHTGAGEGRSGAGSGSPPRAHRR